MIRRLLVRGCFAVLAGAVVCAALVGSGAHASPQQAADVQFGTPTPPVPLFFREPWRQTGAFDASTAFRPQHPVTQAAVTDPNLTLTVYDPAASRIPELAGNLPPNTNAADWRGPTCVLMSGYNQSPPPARVPAGEPTDPPNLWTGACTTPVAVTLKDRSNHVDLTGLAKIRWVTRVSGFHVIRPVIRLADGTYLVGDYGEGAAATNSTAFLETEVAVAPIRWLALDITRVVTRGTWVQTPDLRRVDEVGFATLLPGSGHGWGGFVNVARIEVYGRAVPRGAGE
jgi:hypothetical protein